MTQPPVEFASVTYPIEGQEKRYDGLSGPTGLPIAVIRELVVQHRICDLYDIETGCLLSRQECHDKFGAPKMTGREALEVLRSKSRSPAPVTPAQAQRELYRLRRKGYEL
jgi:hypothetical protein